MGLTGPCDEASAITHPSENCQSSNGEGTLRMRMGRLQFLWDDLRSRNLHRQGRRSSKGDVWTTWEIVPRNAAIEE